MIFHTFRSGWTPCLDGTETRLSCRFFCSCGIWTVALMKNLFINGWFRGTQIYGNPLIKGTKGWDSAMYSFQAHDATPSWPLAHQVSTASMSLQRPVPVQSLSPMGLLKRAGSHGGRGCESPDFVILVIKFIIISVITLIIILIIIMFII